MITLLLTAVAVLAISYVVWKHFTTRAYRAKPKDIRDTVLFTGASKGIGFSLAKLFVRDGFNLIMVARNQDDLEQARNDLSKFNPRVQIHYIMKDLGTNENAPQEIFDEVTTEHSYRDLRITHLVNDAGLCLRGEFLEIPLERQLAMSNLLATSYLKMCFLWGNYWKNHPSQTTRRILNVSSIGGVLPTPFLAAYCAAKHYTHALSIALSDEFQKHNISVTSLCPGYTMTPAIPKAGLEHTLQFATNNYDSSDRVAVVGYYAMMHAHRYVVVGWMNNVIYWMYNSLWPLSFYLKFMKLFGSTDVQQLKPSKFINEGFAVNRGNEREMIAPSQQ